MQPSDDQPPLDGMARSLDELFNSIQAEPPVPPMAEPARVIPQWSPPVRPPDAREGGDSHDLPEGPLLDADTLVQEISGPAHEQPRTDPEEERRARIAAATDSLAQAVHAFTSDRGDREALAQRIRDEAAALKDENHLEPIVEATEVLARAASATKPSLARELAHELTTPSVSAGLALRLGAARDEARRAELIEAFRRLDEEAAVALAGALAEADDRTARRNLVDGLVAMGDEGLKQAEQMVQEGNDWGVIRNGVAILGELGGERAVAHLMDTIQHHKPQVRKETISALARIGGEGAMLLLMGRLEDEDESVRATAVRALGNLGSERVVKTLLGRLDGEDSEEVLQEMLRALGQLGDPGAVPAIEKRAVGSFMRKPPSAVRVAAYRALALIGTPHAKKLIEEATADKDAEVRALARSLVGRS